MLISKQLILARSIDKIYFHGTSSVFLRSILKKGLIPTKQKVWDKTTGFDESLEGVYLTRDFSLALAASQEATDKFGGNWLVIIAHLKMSPSTILDEDSITLLIKDYPINYSEPLEQKTLRFYEKLKNFIYLKTNLKNIRTVVKTLELNKREIYKLIQYKIVYDLLLSLKWDKEKWKYFTEDNGPPSEIFDYEKHEPIFEINDILAKFRESLDKVTKIFGRLTPMFNEKAFDLDWSNTEMRVPSLTYKGKSRIIGVFEIVEEFQKIRTGRRINYIIPHFVRENALDLIKKHLLEETENRIIKVKEKP